LRERGMGIIYITHRMDELRAVGDRVTILATAAPSSRPTSPR